MFNGIANPQFPLSFANLGNILLPISGTILGLVYAGMTYWLRTVGSQFEYAADLLEDIIRSYAKVLIDLLVGVSLISFFGILESTVWASVAFWVVSFLLLRDLLFLLAQEGLSTTLSSKKFIPEQYGRVKSFFRKILNCRFTQLINFSNFMVFASIGYPLFLTWSHNSLTWHLTAQSGSTFLIIAFVAGIWELRHLLVRGLDLKKNITDQLQQKSQREAERSAEQMDEPELEWGEDKRNIQRNIIKNSLEKIGIKNLDGEMDLDHPEGWSSHDLKDKPAIDSPPWVKKTGSCVLDLITPYHPKSDEAREYILAWTCKTMKAMATSKSDVHYYTVIFRRRNSDDFTDETYLAQMKAKGNKIRSGIEEDLKCEELIKEYVQVFLDEPVADY